MVKGVTLRIRRAVLLSVFFLSGFVGLVYETLWQKQMIMLLGASAPAIAVNGQAMPLIQSVLHAAYLSVAHACGATSTVAYSFRFLATMLCVLPATLAMGATHSLHGGSPPRFVSGALCRLGERWGNRPRRAAKFPSWLCGMLKSFEDTVFFG
ncbi:MAG TPA: hypothetical protein VJ550_05960 [Geomonas sp.]|nr:hypothetical protein [Geomonas sp.]